MKTKSALRYSLIGLFLFLSISVFSNSINVSDTIGSNTTWSADTVFVTGDVFIDNGVVLTINAGTKVIFNGHYHFTTKGAIQALGSPGNMILFTSVDTVVGWDGIQFSAYYGASNDSILFTYCKFEYANRISVPNTFEGGVITASYVKKIRIDNNLFINNKASGNSTHGSVMAFEGCSRKEFDPTTLSYIYYNDGLRIRNNVLKNNAGQNGSVYFNYSACEFKNNIIKGDTSFTRAVIFISSSGGDFVNNKAVNNTTSFGVFEISGDYSSLNINIFNNLIANNTGASASAFSIYNSNPRLYNNTIVNNNSTSNSYGGAVVFLGTSNADLKSNIIYGNKNNGSLSCQIGLYSIGSDPGFYNNIIEGGKAAFLGTGSGANYTGDYIENLDVNPNFISPSSGVGNAYDGLAANWSISQGAPGINTGASNSLSLGLPSKDMAGEPRIYNGRIDIGAYENQDPFVAPCTISNNTIWDADTIWVGCNIVIDTNATLSIGPGVHLIFTGHYKVDVRGTILAEGSASENIKFTVIDTMGFYDSFITNGSWAGVEFRNQSPSVDSSKFSYCSFTFAKSPFNYLRAGGAMMIYNSHKIAIENCIFSNNRVRYYGSALYIESSNIVFRNNIVCNNYASHSGSIYTVNVTMDFINNTIVNNKAPSYPGAYFRNSNITVKNSIFWGNRVLWVGSLFGTQLNFFSSPSSKIYNSDIQYGKSNIGGGAYLSVYQDNMSIDPQFMSPTPTSGLTSNGLNANWALNPNAPLVNRGLYNTPNIQFDFGGNPRVVGDTIDMGAFEVQLSPKFISHSPISKSVCSVNAFTFIAASTINVDYQWMHNGQIVTGANSASYMDNAASTSDTGYYYCIMSTPYGSLSTDTARLDILYPPVVTTSPTSISACVGDSTAFSVVATGSQPMSYNWQNTYGQLASTQTVGVSTIGSQNLSNSSNGYPTTFASFFWGDKYQFVIRASELINAGVSAGNIQSIAFNVINVNSCSGLSNYSVKMGTTTSSSLTSIFKTNLSTVYTTASFQPIQGWNTMQFQKPFNWDGASNIVIEVSSQNMSSINAGNATIAQSNTTYKSSLDYHANNKEVYSQTTGTTYYNRPMVQIRTGSFPITNYYLIDSVLSNNASVYKCNISNVCGSVMSPGAQLTVNTAPSVVPIIAAASICENSSYTYSTSATGSAPISYQWYRGGNAISGSTSISHSISSASSSDDGIYYCKATNACGDDSTNQSVMTIKLKPTITSQPVASQTLCANQSASLSVTSTGYYPISYQWYKAGAPIGGAATPNFYMSPISVSDAGIYKCVATNTCGSDQSNNVTIAVNSPPSITYESGDSIRCEGGQTSFDLTATGTAPLTYQWYKGNSMISGSTLNSYSLTNLTLANTGLYHCDISNSCATITSNNKNLTVNSNPQVNLGNDTSFCLGGSTTIGPGYGYFCLWNNGSYNNQLTVTSTGSYFVNVTDQNGCSAVSDTMNVTVVSPYANQELCIVSVDSATGKNAVVWSKTPNQSIAYFRIYKESTVSGIYNIIANQPYDSLSVIIDNTSNPTVQPERYYITVVDSCGNESSASLAHRSMHLTVNKGQNNDWNLIWNAYEGFTPSSYKIYRADTSMNYVNIATVAGSSSYTYLYTDQTATANAGYFYYVEVVHPNGGCSVTKDKTSYNSSRSNRANNGMANPSQLVPAFFGTPTSGMFPLDVHFFDQSQGSPIEWEWDFGDGAIDSIQNPSHIYTQIGVYSVSLVVKDATSDNSIAFQNYITVLTTGISEVDNEFVVKVFPNPYSDKTNIAYALTNQEKVVIEVYTSLGQKVAELVNGLQAAGSYKYQFRAADYGFASGVYVLRMKVGDKLITKKLIEVK